MTRKVVSSRIAEESIRCDEVGEVAVFHPGGEVRSTVTHIAGQVVGGLPHGVVHCGLAGERSGLLAGSAMVNLSRAIARASTAWSYCACEPGSGRCRWLG